MTLSAAVQENSPFQPAIAFKNITPAQGGNAAWEKLVMKRVFCSFKNGEALRYARP